MGGKVDTFEDEELGILEDKTEALALRSKRTERARRKQTRKAKKAHGQAQELLSLPYELILEITTLLRPSDIFNLRRASRSFHSFITQEDARIAKAVIGRRYTCLEKCFRLPVLLDLIDPTVRPLLQTSERQELLTIHKKPYQHVQPPDPAEVCTCLTCMLRWSALCLIVDFAHWQENLEKGEPIPIIPRGKFPEWNQALIAGNAETVRKALRSPLWHARLLEAHLDSTTRSIRRHAANKGNKRSRFRMSLADVESGTDEFLQRSGPPSFDFPYHRDNYYMLEAYCPNRGWNAEKESWAYLPAEQHDRDIEFVLMWAERRRKAAVDQWALEGRLGGSVQGAQAQ